MATNKVDSPNGIPDRSYSRKPAFLKKFSGNLNRETMRIPPERVERHGSELPIHCILMMPRGPKWIVCVLKLANGWHFRVGWPEFVRGNLLEHGDDLLFTLVRVGIFQVKKFKNGTGCPPRSDYEFEVDYEFSDEYTPDVNSSDDDYNRTDDATDSSVGRGVAHDRGALAGDSFPTFDMVLTRSHIRGTLIYFTTESNTWEITLEATDLSIHVKHGWRHFRRSNELTVGRRCTFQLVDFDDIQFYVTFDR
ncbi:B3 domain-containing protein REM1-like [Salvia divinorum]|uniref:B3 domain-containing protein REM1-like n=1 Tax=Salvia divinorum TaxID=28513 RepID=A0ABD1I4I9_SALDI